MTGSTTINSSIFVLNEVIQLYPSLDSLFLFIANNPSLETIFDLIPPNTTLVTSSPVVVQSNASQTLISTPSASTWTILDNQSIFDLSLQFFGDLSQIVNLLNENQELGTIDAVGIEGLTLTVNPNYSNINVVYYIKNNIIPTTNIGTIPIPIICVEFNCDFSCDFTI